MLVRYFGLPGIAIEYSIASLIGGINILILFKSKNKFLPVKPLLVTIFKSVIACIVMAFMVTIVKNMDFGEGKINIILKLGASGVVGVIIYAVMLLILKTKEVYNFLKRGN